MNTSKEPYIYELATYSGQIYPLTQQVHDKLKADMKRGVKLIEMPDTSLIATGNISGITRRQLTMADIHPDQKALPAGEIKFDPNGPGYQKFLEKWKKQNPSGYSKHIRKLAERANPPADPPTKKTSNILAGISDE